MLALTSFDVKKYGRRLMKINLGVVPTVANVYNQVAKDDGSNIIVSTGGGLVIIPATIQLIQLILQKR